MNKDILELRGLGKRYVSARTGETVEALAGVDLKVRQGEFLAIVGPSGCGKSTMLGLIAGFAQPTDGHVLFKGLPVAGAAPERGVIFQDYALFPWRTVMGNVEFGPLARGVPAAQRQRRSRELIKLVGLEGFEHRYPHELSGGMRQRCALARMLANEPELWLMDEPLAAVDQQTRTILQDELLRLWGDGAGVADRTKPTVILVTHAIDEAVFLADRIVVLARRPGRIKAIVDSPLPRPRAEVRTSPEFAALCARVWELIRDEAVQAIAEETG
ncbi:MAG: ABC transporter ATP-binding protein [Pseudomonadota bacterium]